VRAGCRARGAVLTALACTFGTPGALGQTMPAPHSVAKGALEARIVASFPRYVPQQGVSGVISIWGHGNRQLPWMRNLVSLWEQGFRQFHPGISVDYQMWGTSSGIPALFTGIGDVAILGEEVLPESSLAFERAKGYPPFGVEIMTGSLDVRNFDYAQQFFVRADNPLERVTLAELDAIFGEEHRRGTRNIRTWGELGLRGEWADKRITPYGWAIDDSFGEFLQGALLQGSHRWNCSLIEHLHIDRPDGTIYDHGQQILDKLAKDRYGIAVSNIRYAGPNVKPLALAVRPEGPYYQATKETLIAHQYPLARTIPAVIDRPPGMPLDPKVREFLSYLLSREGQEVVNQDGRYLPLSPELAALQRKKLQ
jgi:phosphate transport system substrate-binding protein